MSNENNNTPEFITLFHTDGSVTTFKDYFPSKPEGERALAPAIYSIDFNMKTQEIVLEKENNRFNVPTSLHGKLPSKINTVWKEFKKTAGTMGVLMTGLPGSGKTLMAQVICNKAIDEGIPVFFYPGDVGINIRILRHVLERCDNAVVFIDEFAKRFEGTREQDMFLSLFSDTELKHVLFLVADNQTETLTKWILNRPGRFKFHFDFAGLPKEVIFGYAKEQKARKFLLDELEIYTRSHRITMDILKEVISVGKSSKNVAEFYDNIVDRNVPPFPTWDVRVIVYNPRDNVSVQGNIDLSIEKYCTVLRGKITLFNNTDTGSYTAVSNLNIDLTKININHHALFNQLKTFKFKIGDIEMTITVARRSDNHYKIESFIDSICVNEPISNGQWVLNGQGQHTSPPKNIWDDVSQNSGSVDGVYRGPIPMIGIKGQAQQTNHEHAVDFSDLLKEIDGKAWDNSTCIDGLIVNGPDQSTNVVSITTK